LGIADFALTIPALYLGSDALWYLTSARCPDFLQDHRLREAEAVAQWNGISGFFQPYTLAHVTFAERQSTLAEIHHVASRGSAEAE
jgi:hypothetical protein